MVFHHLPSESWSIHAGPQVYVACLLPCSWMMGPVKSCLIITTTPWVLFYSAVPTQGRSVGLHLPGHVTTFYMVSLKRRPPTPGLSWFFMFVAIFLSFVLMLLLDSPPQWALALAPVEVMVAL